jgi:uncharacterized protein YbjT (DUF2867 family)
MTRVLILGANGNLARHTTPFFLSHPGVYLVLFLRRANRLNHQDMRRVELVEGDATDRNALVAAMHGQDVVYANLAGDMATQARAIVDAMHTAGVKRLIFISSMGIYGEVPGEKYRGVLDPYRDSAAIIEASDLDYTVLRPGWFVNADTTRYQLSVKGEPFKGHDVSMNALSTLIVELALSPTLHNRSSLGVST